MNTTQSLARKSVGHAIQGLRPYIKALELLKGDKTSKGEFRYEISEDRGSARILRNPNPGTETPLQDWVEVEGTNRAISAWALTGKQARLAFIGMKSVKEKLRLAGDHVHYSLDVITGDAHLSRSGELVQDHPTTIAGWAPIGREVEQRYFESYNAAREWNNPSAAAEVRSIMEKLGILRPERQQAGS